MNMYSFYTDNCVQYEEIEKIDKRIYASILHASDFYRTHICHSPHIHSPHRL